MKIMKKTIISITILFLVIALAVSCRIRFITSSKVTTERKTEVILGKSDTTIVNNKRR